MRADNEHRFPGRDRLIKLRADSSQCGKSSLRSKVSNLWPLIRLNKKVT